jgi:hypothetical protein
MHGELRIAYRVLVGKLERRRPLEDLDFFFIHLFSTIDPSRITFHGCGYRRYNTLCNNARVKQHMVQRIHNVAIKRIIYIKALRYVYICN